MKPPLLWVTIFGISSILVILSYIIIRPSPSPTFPVTPSSTPMPVTDCVKSGCSSEICQSAGEKPRISTCIYKSEYACLKYAKCELQETGKCGWTYTDQYRSCLQTGPQL